MTILWICLFPLSKVAGLSLLYYISLEELREKKVYIPLSFMVAFKCIIFKEIFLTVSILIFH